MAEFESTEESGKPDDKETYKQSSDENNQNKSEPDTDGKEHDEDQKPEEKVLPEKDQEPISQALSSIPLDRVAIKKKGFFISFNGDSNSRSILDGEIAKSNLRYVQLVENYKQSQQSRLINLVQSTDRNEMSLAELDVKKREYETKLKIEYPKLKEELAKDIKGLNTEIVAALIAIGELKETIANTSIANVEEQLNKVIAINKRLQNEQNTAIEDEFNTDNAANQKRIAFYEELLETYQEHYKLTVVRLKMLTKDGINNQISSFMIFLGTIAALASGWWFSVWMGKSSSAENSNVRILLLNNLGKYLGRQSLQNILIGLMVYVVGVGLVSFICYRLLVYFGFIEKSKTKDKKAEPSENDESENIDVDLSEEDDVLKGRFKAQNWWAFWLKIAPFIVALVPVITLIAQTGDRDEDKFQSLLDSMVNQFIGTCIAISFSIFTILFFSRVTENAYHNNEEVTEKKSGFTFIVGFFFFALMIGSMFLYRTPLLQDMRYVSILGFLVSCIATGYSIGYGYLFRSLEENAEFLLSRINLIASIRDHYSKPYRVNYTSNKWLRARIYILQQKMMDVIQNRQELAAAIAGGFSFEHLSKKRKNEDEKKKESAADQQQSAPAQEQAQKQDSSKNVAHYLFGGIVEFLKQMLASNNKNKKQSENQEAIVHNMSEVDVRYFSEKSESISQLNKKLMELKERERKLEADELDYLRNQGNWRSLLDQISKMEQKKSNTANLLARSRQSILVEVEKLERQKEEEATLLAEGYYTGIWFREIDKKNNNEQKLL